MKVVETTAKEVVTSKPVETTSSPGSTTKAPTVTIETTTTGMLIQVAHDVMPVSHHRDIEFCAQNEQ